MNEYIRMPVTTTDITGILKQLKICLVLPTYNNAGTLADVIDSLLIYTSDIILVNDGSNDATAKILKGYEDRIISISYGKNRGKGYALKQGFRKALELGFDYALTIDTDGQHRAEDIQLFIEEAKRVPGALVVGSRLLKQKYMPGGNTFANRFSNFWFSVQTGLNFPDTQSGYRLYPLKRMGGMQVFTNRYETELELLVRCAWKCIHLRAIPIEVYYAPPGERVTHFRPFRDFVRISLLNTVLVFGAVCYGYPSIFYHRIFKKRL